MSVALRAQAIQPQDPYTLSYRRYDEQVADLKDSVILAMWDHLKRKAAWGNHVVRIHGRFRPIKIGQLITTEARLTDSLGENRRQVRRAIAHLGELGLIGVERSRKLGTTITLLTPKVGGKTPAKAYNWIVESNQEVTTHIEPPCTSNERIKTIKNLYITPICKPSHKAPAKIPQYSRGVLALLAYAEKRLKSFASRSGRDSFLSRAKEWEEAQGGDLEALRAKIDWLAANEEKLISPTTSVNRIWFIDVLQKVKHAKTTPERREEPVPDSRYDKITWMPIADWLESGERGTYFEHIKRHHPELTEDEALRKTLWLIEGTERHSAKRLDPVEYRLGVSR